MDTDQKKRLVLEREKEAAEEDQKAGEVDQAGQLTGDQEDNQR